MTDPAPIDPEKTRRSRSFGSFLLVLLVLLVVLAIVGNEALNPHEKLSNDQYEYHLEKGDIISQEFLGSSQGTNVIRGKFRGDGHAERGFEVSYPSELLERKADLFRELKAIRQYIPIAPERLLAGIASGAFTPVEARSLTAFKPLPSPSASADESGNAKRRGTAPQVRLPERFFVKALLKPNATVEGVTNLPKASGYVHFDVQLDADDDLTSLVAALKQENVAVEPRDFDLSPVEEGGTWWRDSTSPLTNMLLYFGPWILLLAVFVIFLRQLRSQGGAGGVMSFGRSRAQLYSKENRTNVTFDDVAGADEAKAEVRELVEFLKNPTRFTRIGGRIPRGVLLVGAPGCGKTLLAKAIAGEAEVPFFSISGSDFVEMFVGVGASRVRDLFKQARENSPCIIFLDEIDAVGRRRGSGMGGGHDEREQTLNAILVEMDGFGTDEGIIVIAATNRPDVLDPALLRPGRFDREVTIDLPDLEGRRAILEVHLKRVKRGTDIDIGTLARSTPGYSGADLAAIINEAAIMAVLAKRDEVCMADLEEARDKVRYGRQKKSRKVEDEDRRITAYHEAGHAVIAATLPEIDRPHKVTIVPRGRALGSTMVLPERESYHLQKKKLTGQVVMLFGGRVAESIFCGDISAGASDDIRRATDLARAMVSELGMSERIGPINYAERQGSDFLGTELLRGRVHSEETARDIDEEVKNLLGDCYHRAESILTEQREATRLVAEALLRFETITGEEVARVLAGASLEDLRPDGGRPRPTSEATGSSTRGERAAEAPGPSGLPGLSPA
jgi:cell division protease FtsH